MLIAPAGGQVAITSADLSITEAGLSPDQINLVVTLAEGGQLERAGVPGVPVTSFTQADIDARLIRFVSDGAINGQAIIEHTDQGGATTSVTLDVLRPVFPTVDLGALDGPDGTVLTAGTGAAEDYVGSSVSSIGDINADGFDDFIVGGFGFDGTYTNGGAAFVIFGDASGLPGSIDLTTLDGTDGFRIEGGSASEYAGIVVSGVGDVDGDGIADLAIGSRRADVAGRTDAGAAYILYGSADPFAATIQTSSITGALGFGILGPTANAFFPDSIAGGFDFNNDGIDDIAIGDFNEASNAGADAGVVRIIFGVNGGPGGDIDKAFVHVLVDVQGG